MAAEVHTTSSLSSLKETQEESKRLEYTYPIWHNVVAGGVAGAGSRLVTAPLDLIRIRRQLTPRTMYPSENLLQSWRRIVDTEGGVMALFRGNTAAIYLWVGYAAVQFATYDRVKDWIGRFDTKAKFPTTASFVAGAVAGLLATVATYPFDLCRTIFAARGIEDSPATYAGTSQYIATPNTTSSPPKTIHEFVLQIYRQRGVRGFYTGISPACIQIIPYMGLNFSIYNALTQGDRGVGLSAYAGSVAGAVSKIIIYPIDTVKRRLQGQAFFDTIQFYRPYNGMIDCAMSIANDEGLNAFYRGLIPSVLKTAIATGLSFSLFRFSKNILETFHDAKNH